MELFWLAFIPLCVAFDAVGLLPLFWRLAEHLSSNQRQQAITEAVITASLVVVTFLLVSKFVFTLMGLTVSDVMMAGGTILIVLCLRELLFSDQPTRRRYPSPGVVPLGVPLLAGPAVLTTILLVRDRYGWHITLAALLMNMLFIWVILRISSWLMRWLGQEGAQVISKISNLILTAFGIMLIREGIALALKKP